MKFVTVLSLLLFTHAAWPAEKTFVYCSEGSPSTFNPQMATDGTTFNAASQMLYNRLVEFAQGETKVIPGLAEKWDVSKDGKVFTFHLRKNVKFSSTETFKPTRPFNADDVLFSFHRALKADHPYHKVNGGNYIYFTDMGFDKMIKDIQKVDDYTVRFVLNWPEAPFVADLAMSFAVILSQEYGDFLTKAGKQQQIDLDPVGTGPFLLKRYVKDNSIRYDANPDYWRGRPKLDKVIFAITPDPSVRFQKLKTGECQLVAEPAPQDLKAMAADSKLKVMSQPGANIGYLALNVQKKPFDKLEVRQAIAYALNRESYLQLVYQGTATLAKNLLPPTVWGSDPNVKDYYYNPEKAKQLLAKAGYPNGFDTELWTLPVARAYNPNGKKMGELMQQDLAKVGIKVKLVTYDWPTYLNKTRAGEHQMAQMGWTADNGDPDNFLGILLDCEAITGGSNLARWCDKDYDKLIVQGKTTTDIKARTAAYFKAQELFKKQSPLVTLAHATVFRALAKGVVGYKISPLGVENFYNVDLQ